MSINQNLNTTFDVHQHKTIFVFECEGKEEVVNNNNNLSGSKMRSKLWQIIPCFCGSMLCLSFGIMLGWPSPTYPYLLLPTSYVPITIDQSAMLAGFLMIGVIISTPFSSWSYLGTKYGIIVGYVFEILGWICLWSANSLYWLLLSRLLIGIGNGYGTGQLKLYIKDLCDPELALILIKLCNLYALVGVIVAYCAGPFLTFHNFPLMALTVTVLFLCFSLLLPHTPRELCHYEKDESARKLLEYLRPNADAETEIEKIKENLKIEPAEMSFLSIIKNAVLRKYFFMYALLIFFQQFSGLPATIVYCQIILDKVGTPQPELIAIIYSVTFLLFNIIGIFYSPSLNKKRCLLFSSIGVSIILVVIIVAVYYDVNRIFWKYSFLIIMIIYQFIHTVGLGNVTFTFSQDYFPSSARKVVVYYYIMSFSLLALIITKIFQVLYDRCMFYVPFCLFLVVSVLCTVFILIFVPYRPPEIYASYGTIKQCHNQKNDGQ